MSKPRKARNVLTYEGGNDNKRCSEEIVCTKHFLGKSLEKGVKITMHLFTFIRL